MSILGKKGINGIVTSVLTIVIVFASILTVWNFVRPTLNTLDDMETRLPDFSPPNSQQVSQEIENTPESNEEIEDEEIKEETIEEICNDEIDNDLDGGVDEQCENFSCTECDDGIACKRNECGSLQEECFYEDSGIKGFSGECFSCKEAVSCENYGNDEESCLSDSCTFSNCVWGENGCYTLKTPSVCGNNNMEEEEQCDDGNNIDNDGCSSACIKECQDSDGGKVFTKKGSIQVHESVNKKLTYEDSCSTTKAGEVLEFYCNDGKVESAVNTCQNGCKNGACVSKGLQVMCTSLNDPKCLDTDPKAAV